MAHRRYIQSAAPYAQVNSTCFIAAIEINQLGHKTLVPVYKEADMDIPTNQNDILRLLEGVDIDPANRTSDTTSMSPHRAMEMGSSIDGAKAEYAYYLANGYEVPTESF